MIAPPRTADGPLLLADIGGYTGFLRFVQTAHADDAFADGAVPDAYKLVSSLLDAIVGRLVPPFTCRSWKATPCSRMRRATRTSRAATRSSHACRPAYEPVGTYLFTLRQGD